MEKSFDDTNAANPFEEARTQDDPNLFHSSREPNRLNQERDAVVEVPKKLPELVEEYEKDILLVYNMPSYRRHPKLCEFVNSQKFETLMTMPILFNCGTIGISANCTMECRTGQHWCSPCSEDTRLFLGITEHLLTFIFVVEWMIRMYVFGPRWLKDPFNFFDSSLVFVTGVMIVWILEPAGVAPDSLRSIQVMRAFRLMRLSRVVKTVPEFKEMWLLVQGLAESMGTLFWSVLLILFLLYIFGITATELVGDESVYDMSNEEDVYLHSLWKNIPRSMFTLIQFMTLDSWTGVARPMIKRQPYIWMFFILFIAIATFVLMNLVTAVIVNNALDITKKDEEAALMQMEAEKKAEFEKLGDLFHSLDADGSGSVDRAEFEAAFELPAVRDKLKVLDFEQSELLKLFDLIDKDGGGELQLDEFLQGLRQMRGNAKSKDLMALQSNLRRCLNEISLLAGKQDGEPVSQKPKLNIRRMAPGALQEVGEMMELLGLQVSQMEERLGPSHKSSRAASEAGRRASKDSPESPKHGNAAALSPMSPGKIVCTDPDVQNLADSIVGLKTWGQGVNNQIVRLAQCLDAMTDQDAAAKALGQFAMAGRGIRSMVSGIEGFRDSLRAGTAPPLQDDLAGTDPFPLPGAMPFGSERPVTSPDTHVHVPQFAELREAAQASGHEQALMNLEPHEVLI